MTAPALPEDVERAIAQFAYAVRREANEPGEPSTTYATENAAALRAAIAAHVATGGEPVAYDAGSRVVVIGKAINEGHNFVGRTGVVVEPIDHKTARWVRFDGDDNKTSVPMRYLALHPTTPVAPSFDAALAALDVENDYAPDRGTTYAIAGLDDVRAAHAEAVQVAVEAERVRCMADCDAIYASVIGCADDDGNFRVGIQAGAQRCTAAIRARGVAKPRTDSEASEQGAKS